MYIFFKFNLFIFFFFCRLVKSVYHNTSKFQTIDMNKFHRFETQLFEIEGQLFDGNIYQVCLNESIRIRLHVFIFIFFFFLKHCVEQIFDDKTNYVSKNTAFLDEFSFYLKSTFDSVEPLLSML